MTRATPGTRIRITVDQWGAPVGSVAVVELADEQRVRYVFARAGRVGTFYADHDCYEVVGV